ncbi:hypothetical protein FB639_005703, partial [Coemansia asiatica]
MSIANRNDYATLSRTLCSNPHRSVLIKNALQYQSTMGRRVVGHMPNEDISDLTLFSACGIRARVEDLQPENDPFILDNIFKSPKRRRRGLLSWSAIPGGDILGNADRPPAGGPIREISSQLSARNIRRSILRNKCGFVSIRRRQRIKSGASASSSSTMVVGEHTRSISDPTSAVSAVSPAPTAASTISEASSRDSASTQSSDTAVDKGLQTWHAGAKSLCARPLPQRLPHAQAIVYRQTEAFTHKALFELSECSSTLRGVPGHPAPGTRQVAPPRAPIPLSVDRGRPPEPSEIQRPPPVHVRAFDSRLRSQRCSSMPCATPDLSFPFDKRARPLSRMPRPGIPDALLLRAAGRFNGVKNSLEIKQPMP